MSFLTSQLDLSSTIFTNENLLGARKYLSTQIAREDPAWLKNPQGRLGEHWRRDEEYPACVLIDFAITVSRVADNITHRSVPLLSAKVKEGLLRAKAEKQFIENYTEFQAASVLIEYASPLSLDPIVPEEKLFAPDRPPTPDFALRLPDGDVALEVTVFHVGILDEWENLISRIATSIQQHMFKQQRTLLTEILLPLPCNINIDEVTNHVLNKIDTFPSGSFQVGNQGLISWKPWSISIVEDSSSSFLEKSPSGIRSSSDITVDRAFFRQWNTTTMPEADILKAQKLALNSLRNTLNRKHDQLPRDINVPFLLIIRLGHYRLISKGLIEAINQRIWPNKQYDWITGIVLFTPRQGFSKLDVPPHMELCPNPNARCKVSNSLKSLFTGTEQYHLNL